MAHIVVFVVGNISIDFSIDVALESRSILVFKRSEKYLRYYIEKIWFCEGFPLLPIEYSPARIGIHFIRKVYTRKPYHSVDILFSVFIAHRRAPNKHCYSFVLSYLTSTNHA